MKNSVGIIDCGINNINSLQKAFHKIEVKAEVIENSKKLKNFSHLVLPGVGSFDKGMSNLKDIEKCVLSLDEVKKYTDNKAIKKIIYIKEKLVNIVV